MDASVTQPTVEVVTHTPATANPQVQKVLVAVSTPKFSHDEELPLKLNVKAVGMFCRRLRVTTIEEIWYRDAVLHVIVPAGFVSDLASIPRIIWCVLSPWDIALESIFHDQIYRQQPVKRVIADAALMSMLEERGSPWYVRWPVYLAVRCFGWKAWKKNAEELE